MREEPLAYHITFGTYGTRLHGDPRGTVCRAENRPGDPIIGKDDVWERLERKHLSHDPVYFSKPQQRFAQELVIEVCKRGGWTLHACAVGPDHVHVLLTTDRDVEAVRRWLKRWLGEAMQQAFAELRDRPVWAECGSIRRVWTQAYFGNVFEYLERQRA